MATAPTDEDSQQDGQQDGQQRADQRKALLYFFTGH